MPRLQVFLFGTPRVFVDGQEVKLARLKSHALLAHLLVENRIESRNSLATMLWPESSQSVARTYLRQAFYLLQRELGKAFFVTDDENMGIMPHAPIDVDVWQFEHLVNADPPTRRDLCAAVELATADFLDGFTLPDAPAFDDWQTFQRQRLRQILIHTLESLIQQSIQAGDLSAAVDYARRCVQLDPLDDAARCTLIQILAQMGQTGAALREYREFTDLLKEELDLPPAPETTALVESIRREASVARTNTRSHADDAPYPTTVVTSNLPQALTPFIGRERELAELSDLIADPAKRLITITAPGGMGKTRLALAVAQAIDPRRFPHGIFFVHLAPLNQDEPIVSAIARVLGVALNATQPQETQLIGYLLNRSVLLVLDNFEHLLQQADQITRILRETANVRLLITSRERLHLHAEQVYPLQGLAYGAQANTDSAGFAAVRLFEQCAHRNAPDFTLSDDVLADVVRICRLVEGMPLAIELAAAWVGVLSPAQIAAEI
ncbi:MAG: NACHT domain-containing protein, partial [Caldilineaceae bacterium]|nr:NACHT domain-containing protein [Caldilineaceae bacterium]